jgi:hypothetical protein
MCHRLYNWLTKKRTLRTIVSSFAHSFNRLTSLSYLPTIHLISFLICHPSNQNLLYYHDFKTYKSTSNRGVDIKTTSAYQELDDYNDDTNSNNNTNYDLFSSLLPHPWFSSVWMEVFVSNITATTNNHHVKKILR